MKTKLKLILFSSLITLSFFSFGYLYFTNEEPEEQKIETSERESQVIPIVAFDIFQLFLKN